MDKLAIAAGLVRLRQAGRLHCVWIDNMKIRVQEERFSEPHGLTWGQAALLVTGEELKAVIESRYSQLQAARRKRQARREEYLRRKGAA